LLLPAGNEIRSIRLRLLFDFQLRGIVHRWIIGERDVGNPLSPRLLSAEDGILERRPGRFDRADALTSFGLASAISQPNGPDCECVRMIAGPMRSSNAAAACWLSRWV
jgi:hypothetical protein